MSPRSCEGFLLPWKFLPRQSFSRIAKAAIQNRNVPAKVHYPRTMTEMQHADKATRPRIQPAEEGDDRPLSVSARLGRLQFHQSGKFRVLQFADIQDGPDVSKKRRSTPHVPTSSSSAATRSPDMTPRTRRPHVNAAGAHARPAMLPRHRRSAMRPLWSAPVDWCGRPSDGLCSRLPNMAFRGL